MLPSALKATLRRIFREKSFTLIKIGGFTIGISTCLFIFIWLQDELSYDRFHQDADRIFRVYLDEELATGEDEDFYLTPPPLALKIKEEMAGVEATTRIYSYTLFRQHLIARTPTTSFIETEVFFAEPSFFEIFSFELRKGDPVTALQEVNSVVLTESTAERYFGQEEPLGKLIDMRGKPHQVTGVIADPPANSHMHFKMLVSASSLQVFNQDNWNIPAFLCYVKLAKDTEAAQIEKVIHQYYESYQAELFQQMENQSFQQYLADGNRMGYALEPLTSIHLHAKGAPQLEAGGNPQYLLILGMVLVALLMVSVINYIILTNAQYRQRAREMGVRKVLGAGKRKLILLFTSESLVLLLISTLISLVLVQLLMPEFNILAGKQLNLFAIKLPVLLMIFILLFLVSTVTGIFPSLTFLRLNPVKVLKGEVKVGRSSVFSLQSMQTMQFVLSIGLIMGSLVMYKQVKHLLERDLGFTRQQVVTIENPSNILGAKASVFREHLSQNNQIQGVSFSSSAPPRFLSSGPWQSETEDDWINLWQINADDQYLPLYQFQVFSGRNFGTNDSTSVIINETAARALGLQDPLGKYIRTGNPYMKQKEWLIVGVIKDFHFASPVQKIEPFALLHQPASQVINLRLSGKEMASTLAIVEKEWRELTGNAAFQYSFVDEAFDALYRSEMRLGQVMLLFTILSVFIAAIGLIGLTAYQSNLKIKEMGIRKVLGADFSQFLHIFYRPYLWLIGIASLISAPLVWWMLSKWLQNFAYRVHIEWQEIVIPVILIAFLTFLIIGYFSLLASRRNPVESLRSE